MSHSHTLAELAKRFDLELRGDPAHVITGVATLARADTAQLGFLANPRYRSELAHSKAGAVILRTTDAAHWQGHALIAHDPYVSFARIAALFETRPERAPGIHPSASIAPDARIDASASIGPHVSIGARSQIGPGVRIGAGCQIGEDCQIGPDCELVANVTLVCRVRLGARVRLHPGAVLGADGFGLAMHEGHWIKVPQLGGVVIGDDCEIGANTTIDRGALDDTVLENDVRLDNLIQIGHNVSIGAHTAIAGCVGIAGSTRIGRYCLIGGAVGIAGHLSIADRTTVLGMSMVSHSISEPGGTHASGMPARDARAWRRTVARLNRLGHKTDSD